MAAASLQLQVLRASKAYPTYQGPCIFSCLSIWLEGFVSTADQLRAYREERQFRNCRFEVQQAVGNCIFVGRQVVNIPGEGELPALSLQVGHSARMDQRQQALTMGGSSHAVKFGDVVTLYSDSLNGWLTSGDLVVGWGLWLPKLKEKLPVAPRVRETRFQVRVGAEYIAVGHLDMLSESAQFICPHVCVSPQGGGEARVGGLIWLPLTGSNDGRPARRCCYSSAK